MRELKNHRVARPDEIRCKDCRCGVQMTRDSILGMIGCYSYGWTCIYYLPERIATEHHMTCDLAERKDGRMNDQEQVMVNSQKLENDLQKQKITEPEKEIEELKETIEDLRLESREE